MGMKQGAVGSEHPGKTSSVFGPRGFGEERETVRKDIRK